MASAPPTDEADRAAAAGDLPRAIGLLQHAAQQDPGNGGVLLKLASLQRAAGRPAMALDTIERALTLMPLDFMALLMRASLLERLGDARSDEAYANALAGRTPGALPPQVSSIVDHAEQRVAVWRGEREARLGSAVANLAQGWNEEEAARIARFGSNIVRRSRTYHSEPTDFFFPGLMEREFHPRRLFPWLGEIEAATDAIAEDLASVMAAERAELVPYISYADHEPLRQWKPLNRSLDWTAIHLLRGGQRVEANAHHCPRTMALLDRVGQPAIPGASPNAMFSLLAPHTVIPPHVGINNARLVCHLPLIVPAGCWFRVGAETRYWERGKAFVFDDTIEHEAANPSDELRVVLIFDLWHPDLSERERSAVAAMIGCDASSGGGQSGSL